MIRALLPLMLLVATPATAAALSPAGLATVGSHPAPGATLPAQTRFLDQDSRVTTLGEATRGEPTVLLFADMRCSYLCGPALVLTAGALQDSGLDPSTYHLTVIGIDPRDGPADARAMRDARLKGTPGVRSVARLLSGSPAAIAAAAHALGYRFRYDAEHGQFAHDASVYILDPQGRVADVVSPFELRPERLRSAIVAAGQGRLAALVDQVHVLCYGLDPSAGLYNRSVVTWLRIGGAATAAAIALLIFAAMRRGRRRAA